MRVDAAGEVVAELALDVPRKTSYAGASFIEEGLEMLGNDLVEEASSGRCCA